MWLQEGLLFFMLLHSVLVIDYECVVENYCQHPSLSICLNLKGLQFFWMEKLYFGFV